MSWRSCVCVRVFCGREQIHERHTIYSNFNSFRYLLKRSAKAFKYRTLEMKNLLWFRSKDTVCAITHSLCIYNFFFASSSSINCFFFQSETQKTQQNKNNNNFDFINFVFIRTCFFFQVYIFLHIANATWTYKWINSFIHMCQIYTSIEMKNEFQCAQIEIHE